MEGYVAMTAYTPRVWTSCFRKIVIIGALIILGFVGTADSTVISTGGERAGPSQAGPGANYSVSLLHSEREGSRIPGPKSEYWFRQWVKGVQNRHAVSRRGVHISEEGPPQTRSKSTIDNHDLLVVDKRGCGHFTSVQAFIDFIPHGNKECIVIMAARGVYEKKVPTPNSKPYITLKGGGREVTLINWYAAAQESTAIAPLGSINNTSFGTCHVSAQNTAPHPEPCMDGWQAVAVHVPRDYAAFFHCGFFGGQDTIYNYRGRHYFKKYYGVNGALNGDISLLCSMYKRTWTSFRFPMAGTTEMILPQRALFTIASINTTTLDPILKIR